MYEKTKQYIFSEIGKRVKKKKKEKKLTYYQLAGYKNKEDYKGSLKGQGEDNEVDKQFRYNKFDYSLITNIAGGRAYPKKNPNLVPDLYIEHLSEKLGFTSGKELLWGNFEEDLNILKKIFQKLYLDILYGEEQSMKDVFNNMLIDYVPYAEYYTYYQMFVNGEINMPKFPNSRYSIAACYYKLNEDKIYNQNEIQQKKAINFIWYKYNDVLVQLIKKFLENEFVIKNLEVSLNETEKKNIVHLKEIG